MHRSLNTILTEVNTLISDNLTYSNNEFYTQCVLQEKDDRTFPMTRTTGQEGVKVVPKDTKNMIYYHRIVDSTNEVANSGKGVESYRTKIWSVLLIGVGYRPNISSNTYWDNEELCQEVEVILGTYPILSGKEILICDGQSETDVHTILTQEYAGNDLKRNNLRLVAFGINYTIKQRVVC